jgi:glycosyltransferase involved in cell wall biosynthesis
MRIAYLSSSPIPSRYANSVHVMKMCQALAAAGHDVDLHARHGDGPSDDVFARYGVDEAFRIYLSSRPAIRAVGSLVYAGNVRRRVRSGSRPDLIYARNLYSLAAVAGMGVPMVYEAHTLPANAGQRLVEARLFRHPDFRCLVVISDALRRDYLALFPWLPEARVLVAHDGADVPDAHSPDAPPPAWNGRPGALQVGYVGHLYPGKGMEIVAALPERLPDVDFHVVGGTEADLAVWRARVTAPNLTFHGFVAHARLGAYYDRCDVLLAPLQRRVALQRGKGDIARWTSPLKLFEYMAHGRAIIVSDLPVLEEIIEADVTGLVAPAADPDAWARQIARLRDDEALGTRLGEAARAALVARYTWRTRAERVLDAARVVGA